MANKPEIIIIGAGLTGLTLAHLLRKQGIDAKLLEARNRIGGRIFTQRSKPGADMEMGATWLGQKHTQLRKLLQELKLDIYPQELGEQAIYEPISTSPPQLVQLPPNNDPSYRIKGGTATLIDALAASLNPAHIHLSEEVTRITQPPAGQLEVHTQTEVFLADQVVITLPPNLWQAQLNFNPPLPDNLRNLARQTHTWMGESIKVGLSYEQAFWQGNNTSGTIFSSVGPVPEMYDQSDADQQRFALVGFLNGAYATTTPEHRQALVVQQLEKYYGSVARTYLAYEEVVWAQESLTFTPYASPVLPHQNNGQAPLRDSYWEGKLLLAGSETAPQHPGYMDGAVESAHLCYEKLMA